MVKAHALAVSIVMLAGIPTMLCAQEQGPPRHDGQPSATGGQGGPGGPGDGGAGAGARFANASPTFKAFMQARQAGDRPAAIAALQQGVAEHDVNAMAQLAEEYRGDDVELAGAVPRDYKRSFELTKAAVDGGSNRALTDLGILYMRGEGIGKNNAAALSYFLRADARGDRKAARYVGLLHDDGASSNPDYREAAQYYRKAAENGDITSQCLLGSLYERGRGVPQSYDQAIDWYTKASQRGDLVASDGMLSLGHLYATRTDGKRDVPGATGWYQKAAAQQNVVAKASLARLASGKPETTKAGGELCMAHTLS